MTQEAQEAQETQKPQEHEKLELKLSATVTALVNAVEDMSSMRAALGVVHLERGKATVADGFTLAQVEDKGIVLEGFPGVTLDVPFSVLKPHCGKEIKEVTVTVPGNGAGTTSTISVAHRLKGKAHEAAPVTYKTETYIPTTTYPNVARVLADALDGTYSACVALDASKIKRLLRLFDAIGEKRVVRFYIPTTPTAPILLTISEGQNDSSNVKALLMPMYVDWGNDGIKKEAAGHVKYEEQ